jgi:hypothetical protein
MTFSASSPGVLAKGARARRRKFKQMGFSLTSPTALTNPLAAMCCRLIAMRGELVGRRARRGRGRQPLAEAPRAASGRRRVFAAGARITDHRQSKAFRFRGMALEIERRPDAPAEIVGQADAEVMREELVDGLRAVADVIEGADEPTACSLRSRAPGSRRGCCCR